MADEYVEITTSVIDAILGARASGGRLSVEGDNLFLEYARATAGCSP